MIKTQMTFLAHQMRTKLSQEVSKANKVDKEEQSVKQTREERGARSDSPSTCFEERSACWEERSTCFEERGHVARQEKSEA